MDETNSPTLLMEEVAPAEERRSEPNFRVKKAMLTRDEIRRALGENYKPILTLEEAAHLIQVAPNTLKKRICEGHFKQSAKRGKPLRFWTERFIQEFMR